MSTWLHEHQALVWTALFSVGFAVLATVGAAVILICLPANYFQKPHHNGRGAWRLVLNIGGWFLVIAGVAMLILPGPGALIVLLGVMMADFPGKARVQRWMLSRGPILKPANWLRSRFHKPPLKAAKKPAVSSGRVIPAAS